MKKTKLNYLDILDILPTIAGVVTIVDLVAFNGNLIAGLPSIVLAYSITPVLAALSLATAIVQRRKFTPALWLNTAWLIVGILVVAGFVNFQLNYHF